MLLMYEHLLTLFIGFWMAKKMYVRHTTWKMLPQNFKYKVLN